MRHRNTKICSVVPRVVTSLETDADCRTYLAIAHAFADALPYNLGFPLHCTRAALQEYQDH